MAATRILSEFTYRSGVPTQAYRFTVVVDEQGLVSVRNIQSPIGLIIDSVTSVPQSVVDDISAAIGEVENILAQTSAVNGTLTFSSSVSEAVVFTTAMASTTYRVVLSPDTFVPLRITNKTTTGFTVEAGAEFTGSVGYDVFV
jgi:hypothetical protein